MHVRASSVAWLISARVMSRSRLPRNALALAFPLAPAMFGPHVREHGVLEDSLAEGVPNPEVVLGKSVALFGSLPDRVEIVLCQEHHDGEATRHDHGSSYADQPWYFIYRLQMWATLPSSGPSISESGY